MDEQNRTRRSYQADGRAGASRSQGQAPDRAGQRTQYRQGQAQGRQTQAQQAHQGYQGQGRGQQPQGRAAAERAAVEHSHHVQTSRAQDAQTQRRREAARRAAQAKREREAQNAGSARGGAAGTANQNSQPQKPQLTPEEELRSSRINMLEEEHAKYSRDSVGSKYSKTRKRTKRRKRWGVVLVLALVLVLGGGGTAYAYLHTVSGNMHQGVDDSLLSALVDPAEPEDPFYLLLMGVDRSQKREKSEQYAGDTFRSDSMILCRIDPKNMKVTMVSLHRDTVIDMGDYGYQKLNAAHAFGGPGYAVKCVSELAGVPISHYAEIDFDGFKEAVDALGGIEVNVPIEINDSHTGHLDAGKQKLNGKQALILCRSRHSYDDYGDGDRFRAANQRMVLSAVAKKLLHSSVPTMTRTIKAMSKYIVTDMDVTDIVSLAISMRGLDTDSDIYTAMEPTYADHAADGGWYEYVIEDSWQYMMERVDAGLPPTEEDEVDQLGVVMASTGGADKDADADKDKGKSD